MNELIQRSLAAKNKKNTKSQKPLSVLSPKQISLADIKAASDTVKANLIDVLLKITSRMAEQKRENLGSANIAQLAKLTDTAHKLFAWPNAKPIDGSNSLSLTNADGAINVALIRTTPDQLRAKAKEMEIQKLAANE